MITLKEMAVKRGGNDSNKRLIHQNSEKAGRLLIPHSCDRVAGMKPANPISTIEFVKNQYQDAGNLSARIAIHQQFSTNPEGWFHWLFDQINLPEQGRLLELGCGRGDLWLENLARIPAGLQMTLSDSSEGMVSLARTNLAEKRNGITFEPIDAQRIPYPDASFDLVLANHMLYHVPDLDLALAEIHRVLKPGGLMSASTVGSNHMKELDDLMIRFDPTITTFSQNQIIAFNLENGPTIVERYIPRVRVERYVDSLCVSDAEMLIAYILSYTLPAFAQKEADLRKFIHESFRESNGQIQITKDSGVILAYKQA
jgi:SAM-dependent methyltransferase